MPRGKKFGRAAKASHARSLLLSQSRDQVVGASKPGHSTHPHAFTLKDEARNTGHGSHIDWGRDGRLRSRPVGFVSAGLIEPLKAPTVSDSPGDEPSQPDGIEQGSVSTESPVPVQLAPETLRTLSEVRGPSEAVIASNSQPEPEEPGLYYVDVVGDKTLATGNEEPPKISSPRSSCDELASSDEDVILFKGRATANQGILAPYPSAIRAEVTYTASHILQTASMQQPPPPYAFHDRDVGSSSQAAAGHVDASEDEVEDSVAADYLLNLADDGDDDSTILQAFSLRALGGSDDEFDFGHRTGGSEYLVTPAMDDGEPTSAEAVASQSSSQSSSSEDEADLEVDDEQLARMLAKQEELGLGSDKLILFSQEFSGSKAQSAGIASEDETRTKTSRSRHKKSNWQSQGATALANALDEIDLGDWHQRGPPRKAKGRQGEVHFGLSDSEREEALRAAWKKDRARKKERKQERESLRAQGLLGKHADANDPRNKYGTGMTLDDIKSELRAFLAGSEASLSLPPMDASARKIIHELANRFKIKSKSAGSGDQRRPALYRTKNTVSFVETEFEYQFSRVGRRYFPRLDTKSKSVKKSSGAGRASHAAVTYRDGEVVGGSAPELGLSNKGRAMLERMGWSSGTGLGASDNTGILQPVAHVVKRSKAGLG